MTDQRDPRIMTLIVELAESSRSAPSYVELEEMRDAVGIEPVRPLQAKKRPAWLIVAMAAAAVLVVIGGVALLARDGTGQSPVVDQPDPKQAVPDEDATPPTTEAAITTEPIISQGAGPRLSFVAADSPVDGRLGSGVWFNGALYALSDIGGNDPRCLYRSTDGLTWELIPGFPGWPGALRIGSSRLQTDGDRLVNVAVPGDGDFIQVNTSTNGDDWISSTIQLPLVGDSNMAGEFRVESDAAFATGPRGMVVAVTIRLIHGAGSEGEGFANGLVDPDEGIHVEVVDLDLDRGLMIVRYLDEDNEMQQIGDLREIDLTDAGFSTAFANLLDGMVSDPDWAPLVSGFMAQLISERVPGDYAFASVGYAWFSSDGATWQRAERSGPLDGGEFTAILATPDRFVATASNTYETSELPGSLSYLASGFDAGIIWESTDGITWTEATDLNRQSGFDPPLASFTPYTLLDTWNGGPVELVPALRRVDETEVWTLVDPPQRLFTDMPVRGMFLQISELGLIGTPTFGWEEPGNIELFLSVDGTTWNRWEPPEFGEADTPTEAWLVGVGDEFVVVQVRETQSSGSSSYSLWVGRLP